VKTVLRFSFILLALCVAWGQPTGNSKTDDEIKQTIIKESIASYAKAK
jgi:hypothetical protein